MSNKIYRHSPQAPKQVKFPPRTRIARTAPSAASANRKRQSTLTQLDYVSTPSTHTREIPCSDDDDDDEFVELLPKKRRRVGTSRDNSAKNDQSTLTQNVRQLRAALKLQEAMDSDDEDFNNIEDNGLADGAVDLRDSSSVSFQTPRLGDMADISSVSNTTPGWIVESSHREDDSTRPTTADSNHSPHTPQRARSRVVPSSETPSSLHLSPYKLGDRAEYARSPLKERSVNFHAVKFETPKRPRFGTVKSSHITASTSACPTVALHTPQIKSTSRRSPYSGHTQSVKSTRPPLERVTTIADSEADPDEFENYEDDKESLRHHDGDLGEEMGYSDGHHQHTYDPVNAALDLDAARFGSTQRYLPSQKRGRRRMSQEIVESEDELDDAERSPQVVRDSQATQDEWGHPNRMDNNASYGLGNTEHDVGGIPSRETPQATANNRIQVPSSPLLRPSTTLRPSQISTVVSTQDSYATANRFVPCSPQQSASDSPETTPSSPIAQPPWSLPALPAGHSTYEDPGGYRERSKMQQGDSLADFSLPPLPPMSSQR